MVYYSVVIPIKNEEENIEDLIEEIEPVMEKLEHAWELICVDDGSTDQSLLILQNLCKSKPYLRILSFTRNFGQSNAFAAGFEAAHGDYIITLDADRQNDPGDIPNLIAARHEYDLVIGWRIHRHDSLQKKITSRISNWVRSRFCRDGVHDTGCSLKVYRRDALKKIKLFKGMHRFFPALFLIEGFRIKEVPVKHRERKKGKTKYSFFNRSFGPIIDMLAVRWMRSRTLRYHIREEITYDKMK
jgi:dolichol-phosphate mannosyltransferase